MSFKTVSAITPGQCGICHDEWAINDPVIIHEEGQGDKHPLHLECLSDWVNARLAENFDPICPSCNIQVTSINGNPVNIPAHIMAVRGQQQLFRDVVLGNLLGVQQFLAQEDLPTEILEVAARLAILNRHMHIVELLLQGDLLVVVAFWAEAWDVPVLLLQAADAGCEHLVANLLLSCRFDPNRRWLALEAATQKGHLNVVKVLLQHDEAAHDKLEDRKRLQVIKLALKHNHLDIALALIPKNSAEKIDALAFIAALEGNSDVVQLLVEYRDLSIAGRGHAVWVAAGKCWLPDDSWAEIEGIQGPIATESQKKEALEKFSLETVSMLLRGKDISIGHRAISIFLAARDHQYSVVKEIIQDGISNLVYRNLSPLLAGAFDRNDDEL